jgi:hypothetical protein
MSWKPSRRDLETIVEHSVARVSVDTTAKALGVDVTELVLFLVMLDWARGYVRPDAGVSDDAVTPYWMRAGSGAFK